MLALFRGEGLVCEWADEEWVAACDRPMIGLPLAEAFPEEHWRPYREIMSRMLVDCLPRTVPFGTAMIELVPWSIPDGPCGVAVRVHTVPRLPQPRARPSSEEAVLA